MSFGLGPVFNSRPLWSLSGLLVGRAVLTAGLRAAPVTLVR